MMAKKSSQQHTVHHQHHHHHLPSPSSSGGSVQSSSSSASSVSSSTALRSPPPLLSAPASAFPSIPCCSTNSSSSLASATVAVVTSSVRQQPISCCNKESLECNQAAGIANNAISSCLFPTSTSAPIDANVPHLATSNDNLVFEQRAALQLQPQHSFCKMQTTTTTILSPIRIISPVALCLFAVLLLCGLPNWQLLMVTALPRPAADAAAAPKQQQQQHIPVGGLFTMDSKLMIADKSKLPGWMKAIGSEQKLIGIPQLKDVGTHLVAFNDGSTMALQVGEDQEGVCGVDRATIWLEVIDGRQLGKLGIEEQFNAAMNVLSKLREGSAIENSIRTADMRVFPHAYLKRYRTVVDTMHGAEEEEKKANANGENDQLVFALNISCGELSEQGTEIISAAAEAGLNVRVVQGSLQKSHLLSTATVPPPLLTTTTTATMASSVVPESATASGVPTHLIIIVAVILVLILVLAFTMFWARNTQSRKRQKQADAGTTTATNGKGTSGAGAAALNTPMLPSNGDGGESGAGQQSVTKS